MRVPNKQIIAAIRVAYPVGTRVKLIYMEDAKAPPVGTKGTVIAVDDVGTIHVHWDNGSALGLAYGIDSCHKI